MKHDVVDHDMPIVGAVSALILFGAVFSFLSYKIGPLIWRVM